MWRAYRAGGPRAWALPGAVAATAAWAAYLAGQFTSFAPWLAPAVVVLTAAALALLLLARPGGRRAGGRLALGGLGAALAALLLAPSAWAVQVFAPSYSTSVMGAVGPSGTGRGFGAARFGRMAWAGGATSRQVARSGASGVARAGTAGRMGGFGGAASGGALTPAQQRLLAYTRAHDGSAAYVFATTSWSTASPYILAAGAKVLPIGGFSGRVPSPTENRFRHLVDSGEVRYVLLGGGRGRGVGAVPGGAAQGVSGDGTAAAQITAWVQAGCTKVPASAYGGSAATAGSPALSRRAAMTTVTGQTLYLCEPGT
ncbi:hypothetical protein [Streptomyces griseorubiginosus]|uniref:hypothetical protein n=1 Tax=Streptomyces griseorubiginosus TaxID=67304 RepID=UPI003F768442